MKQKEVEAFETKYGFKPTTLGVALDALAVFVNKDNPINEMSSDPGRRDLLQDPQARRGRHHHLGPARPDR